MATLYDYHNTNDTNQANFANADWAFGQTFTAGASYTINHVKLKVYQTGVANTLTVDIQEVDGGTDLPNGVVLATGTLTDIPLAAGWVRCDFVTPVALTEGTVYAIVATPLVIANSTYWRTDIDELYAGGSYVYSNDGVPTWGFAGARQNDFMFECYGDLAAGVATPVDKYPEKKLIAFADNKLFYET